MPIEQLTYTQIAERLGISSEAARAMVKRRRLPRLRTNGRKTLVAIDLEEAQHKPLPARSPRGHQPISDVVATLKAKIAQLEQLEAELDASEERSPGLQADFERECERADRLVTTQDRLVAELEALQALLETAQDAARQVTTRRWSEMSWPERWHWLRTNPGARPVKKPA